MLYSSIPLLQKQRIRIIGYTFDVEQQEVENIKDKLIKSAIAYFHSTNKFCFSSPYQQRKISNTAIV